MYTTAEIIEGWQVVVSFLNLALLSDAGATVKGSFVLITTFVCGVVEHTPAQVVVSESRQRLDFA